MAESFIQVPVDSDGKKVRTNKLIVEGNEVHSDVVNVSDSAGNLINPAKEDGNLSYVVGMAIPKYDYIEMSYDTNGNLTQTVYKQGGSSGTTVATLSMSYDANNNLISVAKS